MIADLSPYTIMAVVSLCKTIYPEQSSPSTHVYDVYLHGECCAGEGGAACMGVPWREDHADVCHFCVLSGTHILCRFPVTLLLSMFQAIVLWHGV